MNFYCEYWLPGLLVGVGLGLYAGLVHYKHRRKKP